MGGAFGGGRRRIHTLPSPEQSQAQATLSSHLNTLFPVEVCVLLVLTSARGYRRLLRLQAPQSPVFSFNNGLTHDASNGLGSHTISQDRVLKKELEQCER